MKRILLVLLIFAVAGGLFAQVSFSGEVGSGVFVGIEDETTVHAYNSDWVDSWYAELTGGYETESGNAGGEFTIGNYSGDLDVGDAYVWYKPIDILTLYAGSYYQGFTTPGSAAQQINAGSSLLGVALTLDPIAGLSFGAGFAPSDGEFGDSLFNFGVSYTLSGTVSAVANLRYNGAGNDGDGQTDAGAGINILALRSLGFTRLAIDVAARNLTKLDTASNGRIIVGPRIGYTAGDLTLGARANIYVPVKDDQDLNVAAQATVSYPVSDTLTAGVGVGYSLKGAVSDTTGDTFAPGSWSGALTRDYSSAETSVLVINPTLSFDVFDGAIDVGYSLQTQLGSDSKLKHAIYVNFSVGF